MSKVELSDLVEVGETVTFEEIDRRFMSKITHAVVDDSGRLEAKMGPVPESAWRAMPIEGKPGCFTLVSQDGNSIIPLVKFQEVGDFQLNP